MNVTYADQPPSGDEKFNTCKFRSEAEETRTSMLL